MFAEPSSLDAMQTPRQGIVTPEAVVLEFQNASIGSRSAAYFIDLIIKFTLLLALMVASAVFNFSLAGSFSWIGVVVTTLGFFLLYSGYDALFETFWSGKTPGKAALGLRVVTTQGAPIRFRQAAIRGALSVIEIAATFGVVATIAIFFSKRHQRLGDMIAGTVIHRERTAAGTPKAIQFQPVPGTEEFLESFDVSGLNSHEYMTIRSFLLRAKKMNKEARRSLGEKLARQTAMSLQAQPPQAMTAEVFLVCVMVAYQRRFQVD